MQRILTTRIVVKIDYEGLKTIYFFHPLFPSSHSFEHKYEYRGTFYVTF